METIAIRVEAIDRPKPPDLRGPGVGGAHPWCERQLGPVTSVAMEMDRSRLPPGAAREILKDFQLWGDDGGDLVERPSLLVQDLAIKTRDNPFLFEAGHLIASGRGLRQLDVDRDMPQSITMDWKATSKSVLHEMCIRGLQGNCLIWNAALNYPGPEHQGYLSIDDDTLVLPLSKRSSGIIPVLHFFGGAWGGWSYACQLLAEKDVPIISGCIEVDFTAPRQYALSHRCPLLSAAQELPPLTMLSFPEGFCIHGDVFEDSWLQAAACWNVEVITISAPCPPWSGAAIVSCMSSMSQPLLTLWSLIL